MNQQQLQWIDYLREENRVLREQLGQRRLRFNDDQRRRLAGKGFGKQAAPRGGYDCHARDPAGLASSADRAEIRWQWQTGMGPAEKIGGDRGSGGAHGERKPQLGVSANPGSAVESGS